jgi:DNA polymerase elongation subunit (family B)
MARPKLKEVDCEILASEDFEVKEYKPKILLLDIETAACVGSFWRNPWQTSIIRIIHDTHMISWSAKWLGGKHVTKSLPDYKGYKPGVRDDKALVSELRDLIDTADIVIGHNLDRFDLPYLKGRSVINGLDPLPRKKTYDTRAAAKRHFGFTSNKMDEIARTMKLPTKISIHYDTWEGCEAGDPKAWKLMTTYNRHDVVMLEQIYLRFRSWDDRHPNLNAIAGVDFERCPSCGSTDYVKRGKIFSLTGWRPDFQCKPCGRRYAGKHHKVTEYR